MQKLAKKNDIQLIK